MGSNICYNLIFISSKKKALIKLMDILFNNDYSDLLFYKKY